ncbi:LapA family protein [Paenibacillus sp. 1P07SE]|uniref:LapA family protein n=1 Tax=Paenibacillus sp. 1P07SE TaxID=3132209 RepID=UPI0039A5D92D
MSKQTSMKVQWLIISALVFAVITAIFAVINVDSVQVNFLFTHIETPLILVILISALLGGLMVFLFSFVRQVQMQRQVRQLEKQLAAAQQEQPAPSRPFNGLSDTRPAEELPSAPDPQVDSSDRPLPGADTSLPGTDTDRER